MSDEGLAGPTSPPQRPPPGIDPIARDHEIRPPDRAEAWTCNLRDDVRELSVGLLTLALFAALGLAWLGGTHLVRWALDRPALTGAAAI